MYEKEGGGGREREREEGEKREQLYGRIITSLLAFLGASQSTGGGASVQTQKREKKPKMTDAEVVAHLSKQLKCSVEVI